jgi:hypothetical protein
MIAIALGLCSSGKVPLAMTYSSSWAILVPKIIGRSLVRSAAFRWGVCKARIGRQGRQEECVGFVEAEGCLLWGYCD